MSELVEFLRARLDKEEKLARAAIADDGGQDGGFEDATWLDDRSHPLCAGIATDAANLIRATAVPRRVLAEVDAKRRIIDEHQLRPAAEQISGRPAYGCEICHDHPEYGIAPEGECETLKLLALPYADQPDYRPEWRPA